MDDRQRAERTEEIRRKMADERVPLDRIFPARVWTPPSIDPDEGVAHFAAADLPSPHGGTVLRTYLLTCAHGTSELTLADHGPDRDGEVLRNMLTRLRERATDAGVTCLCWPKGWMAA